MVAIARRLIVHTGRAVAPVIRPPQRPLQRHRRRPAETRAAHRQGVAIEVQLAAHIHCQYPTGGAIPGQRRHILLQAQAVELWHPHQLPAPTALFLVSRGIVIMMEQPTPRARAEDAHLIGIHPLDAHPLLRPRGRCIGTYLAVGLGVRCVDGGALNLH